MLFILGKLMIKGNDRERESWYIQMGEDMRGIGFKMWGMGEVMKSISIRIFISEISFKGRHMDMGSISGNQVKNMMDSGAKV
jgi:hypothetical protein